MDEHEIILTHLVNGAHRMTRRRFVRTAATAGLALGIGSRALLRDVAAVNFFRAATELPLLSKPRATAAVKGAIPAGATVVDLGVSTNGFRKVSFQGVRGYASARDLIPQNGGSGDPLEIVGAARTSETKGATLFYTPAADGIILAFIPRGTLVQLGSGDANGFREVLTGGMRGWVAAELLTIVGHGPLSFTTRSAAKLRRDPRASAAALLTVPAGATVTDDDLVLDNNFRGVDYEGTTGWIAVTALA